MERESSVTKLRLRLEACEAQLSRVEAEKNRLEETTRHLNFLDNLLDGFFFTNERGEILFLNLALLRLLGYQENERHELVGVRLPAHHWKDKSELETINEQLQQHGMVKNRKLEMMARDGKVLSVVLSAVASFDGQQAYAGAQYTVRLLPHSEPLGTARLRAENRELAALTAIGRSILSTMHVDEAAQHLMAQVQELFGVELAWVYLKQKDGSYRLIAGEELARNVGASIIQTLEEAGELIRLDSIEQSHLFNSQTGTVEELESARLLGAQSLVISPLRAHEKTIGLLVIASYTRDPFPVEALQLLDRIAQYAGLAIANAILYHDLQEAYEELKRAQEQLVEAERQKILVEMAGAAAHELNQPLTVLLGYSNLLARTMKEDDPQRPLFEKIERSTRKISEVVTRLGQITHYRTLEYLDGQPIVDIEAASRREQEED